MASQGAIRKAYFNSLSNNQHKLLFISMLHKLFVFITQNVKKQKLKS